MRPRAGAKFLEEFCPEFCKTPATAEAALDAALLKAHAAEDPATLARLYAAASEVGFVLGQTDRGYFFLTQAYVFALENGDPLAAEFRETLRSGGRER